MTRRTLKNSQNLWVFFFAFSANPLRLLRPAVPDFCEFELT